MNYTRLKRDKVQNFWGQAFRRQQEYFLQLRTALVILSEKAKGYSCANLHGLTKRSIKKSSLLRGMPTSHDYILPDPRIYTPAPLTIMDADIGEPCLCEPFENILFIISNRAFRHFWIIDTRNTKLVCELAMFLSCVNRLLRFNIQQEPG